MKTHSHTLTKMSVRSEPKEMSAGMQQALMIPQDVMRTAAQQAEGPLMAPAPAGQEMIAAAPNDQHLAAANGAFATFASLP